VVAGLEPAAEDEHPLNNSSSNSPQAPARTGGDTFRRNRRWHQMRTAGNLSADNYLHGRGTSWTGFLKTMRQHWLSGRRGPAQRADDPVLVGGDL